jgi:hypothetical protein
MNLKAFALAFFVVVGFVHPRAAAAPYPDNFENAYRIEATPYVQFWNNAAATVQSGEALPETQSVGRTLWFSWVAPGKGLVTLYGGGNFDWAIYNGSSLNNLQRLPRTYLLPTEPGELFYIQIAANDPFASIFRIELMWEPDRAPGEPPLNDMFTNARPLPMAQSYNEFFFWDRVSIAGATEEPGEPRHITEPSGTLWWSIQAPLSGELIISAKVDGFSRYPVFGYRGDTLEDLVYVGASDKMRVSAGETYRLALAGPSGQADPVYLTLMLVPRVEHELPAENIIQNPSFENDSAPWTLKNAAVTAAPTRLTPYIASYAPNGLHHLTLGTNSSTAAQSIAVPTNTPITLKFAYRSLDIAAQTDSLQIHWNGELVKTIVPQATTWLWTNVVLKSASAEGVLVLQNAGGPVMIDMVSLVQAERPPRIISPPASIAAIPGSSALFSVTATGAEPLRYQWFFKNEPLPNRIQSTLVMDNVLANQAGEYFVRITNKFGAVTSSIVNLQIEAFGHPVIRLQPTPATVPAGSYYAFSVLAAGPPPLTYQWSKDNRRIDNATNIDLVFPSVAPTDGGRYTVRVTASNGAVESLPALLTVTPPVEADPNRTLWIRDARHAPVYDADGLSFVSGDTFVGQFYFGPNELDLRPYGPPQIFFEGITAGIIRTSYWGAVPGLRMDQPAFAQMRVWERSKGPSFEHARAVGGKFGRSITVPLVDVHWDGKNYKGYDIPSFSLQAGVPNFTTGRFISSVQNRGTVLFTYEGHPGFRYLIEEADKNLLWTPFSIVTNQSTSFTFSTKPGDAKQKLYRARILD